MLVGGWVGSQLSRLVEVNWPGAFVLLPIFPPLFSPHLSLHLSRHARRHHDWDRRLLLSLLITELPWANYQYPLVNRSLLKAISAMTEKQNPIPDDGLPHPGRYCVLPLN